MRKLEREEVGDKGQTVKTPDREPLPSTVALFSLAVVLPARESLHLSWKRSVRRE